MSADDYDLPERAPCPFCDDDETELHSPFGTALSVATYWCRSCRTAFEWVKWKEPDRGTDASRGSRGGDRDRGAAGRERGPAGDRE